MEFDWGTPDAGSWDEPPATHNGFATTGTFPETLEPGQQKGEKKNEEGQRHDREGRGAEQGDPPTRTSQGEPPREAEQGDPPTEADQGDPLTDDRLLLALHEWLGAVACGAAG